MADLDLRELAKTGIHTVDPVAMGEHVRDNRFGAGNSICGAAAYGDLNVIFPDRTQFLQRQCLLINL